MIAIIVCTSLWNASQQILHYIVYCSVYVCLYIDILWRCIVFFGVFLQPLYKYHICNCLKKVNIRRYASSLLKVMSGLMITSVVYWFFFFTIILMWLYVVLFFFFKLAHYRSSGNSSCSTCIYVRSTFSPSLEGNIAYMVLHCL